MIAWENPDYDFGQARSWIFAGLQAMEPGGGVPTDARQTARLASDQDDIDEDRKADLDAA